MAPCDGPATSESESRTLYDELEPPSAEADNLEPEDEWDFRPSKKPRKEKRDVKKKEETGLEDNDEGTSPCMGLCRGGVPS